MNLKKFTIKVLKAMTKENFEAHLNCSVYGLYWATQFRDHVVHLTFKSPLHGIKSLYEIVQSI